MTIDSYPFTVSELPIPFCDKEWYVLKVLMSPSISDILLVVVISTECKILVREGLMTKKTNFIQ